MDVEAVRRAGDAGGVMVGEGGDHGVDSVRTEASVEGIAPGRVETYRGEIGAREVVVERREGVIVAVADDHPVVAAADQQPGGQEADLASSQKADFAHHSDPER
jgi:hypothetical protein